MKKTLIAAAIAAAVAAPAANAGVIVYGKVHVSIDYLDSSWDSSYWENNRDNGWESENGDMKGWYVASRASRLGFKGTEDLGNGLSLIWKYETGVDVADSPESGGIFSGARNSYIGLAGDWGTFLYGRHDTPMKMSTGRLDLFSDQLGDYNNNGYSPRNNALIGPGFNDQRVDNAIAYISPNWNGFTFAGAIVPGENEGFEANGLADAWSVAGMYSNNGLYLSAAWEQYSGDWITESQDYKQWRIGAGYTMNAFTINAVYESQEDGVWEDESYSADIWQISGAYDFGNNRVKVAYGNNTSDFTDHDGDQKSNSDSDHWAIGLDHKLSKRTTAYAQYASATNDWTENSDVGAPWESRQKGSEDISGFSMGLMHTF